MNTPELPSPRVSIVVPVYNEEEVFALLHKRLTGVLKSWRIDYEVILVDDGSQDETQAILRAIHRSMPERNLYLRGLRTWVGVRDVGVEYERDRRMAGKPKHTFLFRAPAGPERAHRFMNSPDVGTPGRGLGG